MEASLFVICAAAALVAACRVDGFVVPRHGLVRAVSGQAVNVPPPNYLKCTGLNITYERSVIGYMLHDNTNFVASTWPNPTNAPVDQMQKSITDNYSCWQSTFDLPTAPSFTVQDDMTFRHRISASDFPPGTQIVDDDEAIVTSNIYPANPSSVSDGHWIWQITQRNKLLLIIILDPPSLNKNQTKNFFRVVLECEHDAALHLYRKFQYGNEKN